MQPTSSYGTDWALLGGVRFLLACVVACSHFVLFVSLVGPVARTFAMFGGNAAVHAFLVISGYSIAAALEKPNQHYFRRRFVRIYPLYLFALVLTVLLDWSTGGRVTTETHQFQTNGIFVALANALMLQTYVTRPVAFNVALWSLAVEAFFYLAAPSFRRQSNRVLLVLITLLAMIYVLPEHHGGLIYLILTSLRVVIYAWPWLMGFYLFKNRDFITFFVFTLLGTALVRFNHHDNATLFEPLAPVTYIVTIAVLFAASRCNRTARWRVGQVVLFYLGDLSYPIYLLQFPAFIFAFHYLGIRNDSALFAACLIVAAFALYLIEHRLKRTWSQMATAPINGAIFPHHNIVAAERDNGRYFHRQTP